MKIGIASYKGGVGKTSLSFSLAIDLGYRLITNDMSNVLQNYKNARFMPGKISLTEDTIYDFGGFVDKNAAEVLKECDYILVPTIADANSVMKSLQVISEFKHKNIIVVANMVENNKDIMDIEKVIKHHFPHIEICQIRRTKLFRNALEEKLSASELYKQDNFKRHIYKNAFKDYLALLKKFAK